MPDMQAIEEVQGKKAPPTSATTDFPEAKPSEEPKEPAKAEPEEAAADDTAEQEDSAPSDDGDESAANPKGKVPKGVQKRFDELTRRLNDERRAREETERRLAEAERLRQEANQVDDPEPNREAFEDPETWQAARTQWLVRKSIRDEKDREFKATRQAQMQESFTRLQTGWETGKAKAVEKYPDWKEVVESDNLNIAQPVAFALASHPQGHEIAYYLGKHPDEASRLSSMSPLQSAIAIGELGAKLQEPVVETPKPPKPVGSRNRPSRSLNELSMREYGEDRLKQLREARSKR